MPTSSSSTAKEMSSSRWLMAAGAKRAAFLLCFHCIPPVRQCLSWTFHCLFTAFSGFHCLFNTASRYVPLLLSADGELIFRCVGDIAAVLVKNSPPTPMEVTSALSRCEKNASFSSLPFLVASPSKARAFLRQRSAKRTIRKCALHPKECAAVLRHAEVPGEQAPLRAADGCRSNDAPVDPEHGRPPPFRDLSLTFRCLFTAFP